ncbi:MAG: hypothetical protein ACD_22C00040G0001 [uncultured bacterium]|nr:MAG: hypothetical protein ACD_22C00040G0001 [uncultured bacterium]
MELFQKLEFSMKYSCLLFGEGGNDKKFLIALLELEKFKYHTKKWEPSYDSASGSSPEDILSRCVSSIRGKEYDLIICFIDLDKLKTDYPRVWKKKKKILEKKYSNFKIVWQVDNAEDEYRRVLGESRKVGKQKLNELAKKNISKFINSKYGKRILKIIKKKEIKLDKINQTTRATFQ